MMRKYKAIFCIWIAFMSYLFVYQQTKIDSAKYYSLFRYRIELGWLYDNYQELYIEGNVFAYKYEFPYVYTIGRSGFTRVNVIPFLGGIEKVVNEDHYIHVDSIKKEDLLQDTTLSELKDEYESKLVLYNSIHSMTADDQRVYSELKEKMINGNLRYLFLGESMGELDVSREKLKKFFDGLEGLSK